MNQEKLAALRNKYRDLPFHQVDDPEHAKAMLGGTDMLTGIATLCDAPYRETAEELDIALIGEPFDAGVVHRTGACFGPRSIRNLSLIHISEPTRPY